VHPSLPALRWIGDLASASLARPVSGGRISRFPLVHATTVAQRGRVAPKPPAAGPESQRGGRLDSWKEIAAYLNRDVTTVRRWERQEGLPVHRHRHTALGSVYAFRDEIEAWQNGRGSAPFAAELPRIAIRPVVGRDAELTRLRGHLAQALEGRRRTVFVAGELGLGKTALTRSFLDTLGPDFWIVAGQCVEQYGAAEPYLPLIEGLRRLCRDARNPQAVQVVEARAPSWADQILLGLRRRQRSNPKRNSAPELTAGELTDLVEALSHVKPLVLLLEDLHWSDHSTVEFVARLGRRPDEARLLVIGTYRPAELFDVGSPLLRVCRELRTHFQSDEIELSPLTEAGVAELISLDKHWSDARSTAASLKQWSGNPLFLVHIVAHLESTGQLVEHDGAWTLNLESRKLPGVPGTLRALVEEQVERLGAEHRRLLEIASVIGEAFPSALIAHVAERDVIDVETSLDDLHKRSTLMMRQPVVTWPDGTESASYSFAHEFYRQVVYDRLSVARLTSFHHRVGERLELAFLDRAMDISSELAGHFERGHDLERAVRHYSIAADNASGCSADREAQIALGKAAEMVVRLPEGEPREAMVRHLCSQLAASLRRLSASVPWLDEGKDYGTAELGDSLVELARFYTVSGDLRAALELGDRAVAVARTHGFGLLEALTQQASARLVAGDFVTGRSLSVEALDTADDADPRSRAERMSCLGILAWCTWYLGTYAETRQALDRLESVPLERWPASLAALVTPLLGRLGEFERALALLQARQSEPSGAARGIGIWPVEAARGWLLVRQHRGTEGLAILRECERALRRQGLMAWLPPTLAWLAEALGEADEIADAKATVDDGLNVVRRTGARSFDAELYRLRGEALSLWKQSRSGGGLTSRDRDAAEASYWAGITVARQQDARTIELQITMSLSRLLLESGRPDEARQALGPICEAFAQDESTPLLKQARQFLSEVLGGKS
jgi:tetratricopeptide (TPR) repeat protein